MIKAEKNCHTQKNKSSQIGFSLIEVMVVVVILAIFASMISLSVSSSQSRKNRGFYEHIIDSMGYIRLLSAEKMHPIGMRFVVDEQGNTVGQIVELTNAYGHWQQPPSSADSLGKNSMELSASIQNKTNGNVPEKPEWQILESVQLPEVPEEISIEILTVDDGSDDSSQELQPWFIGEHVPEVIWYGNGQAAAINMDIKYNDRLVGDTIQLLPDGNVRVGNLNPTDIDNN